MADIPTHHSPNIEVRFSQIDITPLPGVDSALSPGRSAENPQRIPDIGGGLLSNDSPTYHPNYSPNYKQDYKQNYNPNHKYSPIPTSNVSVYLLPRRTTPMEITPESKLSLRTSTGSGPEPYPGSATVGTSPIASPIAGRLLATNATADPSSSPSRFTSLSTANLSDHSPIPKNANQMNQNQIPKKPKKRYPSNLIPTTMASGPLLSTARRAESRQKLGSMQTPLSSRLPLLPSKRQPSQTQLQTQLQTQVQTQLHHQHLQSQSTGQLSAQSQASNQLGSSQLLSLSVPKKTAVRSASLPHSLQSTMVNDYAYSFMKGTSSSKKRVVTPLKETTSTNSPFLGKPAKCLESLTRTTGKAQNQSKLVTPSYSKGAGHVHLNGTSSNLRIGYSNELANSQNNQTFNNTASTDADNTVGSDSNPRRLQPKRTIPAEKVRRIASYNLNNPFKLNSSSMDTSEDTGYELKYECRRNFSLPTPKEDVYSRLYNEAKKSQPIRISGMVKSQLSRNLSQTLKLTELPRLPDKAKDKTVKPIPTSVSTSVRLDEIVPKVSTKSELLGLIEQSNPKFRSEIDLLSCYNFQETSPIDTVALNTNIAHEKSISVYERGELLRRKDVYYPGRIESDSIGLPSRHINIRNHDENYGFDDKQGNYIIYPNDHINYRYEIESILGKGSFGNVVKCKDHKYIDSKTGISKMAAVKIIKSDINWSVQAVTEIKMLKHLNDSYHKLNSNSGRELPILEYYEHFNFRSHMCIATEVLSLNLFSMIEVCKYKGFSLGLLKDFCFQSLQGLNFIHKVGVIHCDVKPENIMIKLKPSANGNDIDLIVKIIDFGSSCFNNEVSFSYIQSRFYRAPEVIIGAKYDNKIDVWSFGCVAAELFTGLPLLPGKNELEQIALIIELFGCPNTSYIQNGRKIIMKSLEIQKQKLGVIDNFSDIGNTGGYLKLNENATNSRSLPNINEKSIKKTLLFTLFDLDGKLNLQFLNMRLQALRSQNHSLKKSIKVSSKMLEVVLKLGRTNESKKDTSNFTKFLLSIFQWAPQDRPTCEDLLNDPFFK